MIKNLPANAGDVGSVAESEDPTCRRAAKHVCWAATREPVLWSLGATASEPSSCTHRSPHTLEPELANGKSLRKQKPTHHN